jgi:pyrimidine deaminase RibD-like protein
MAKQIAPDQDLAFMKEALDISRDCKAEDERVHPYVGAVIVTPTGQPIAAAYRGQNKPGNHAEQEALSDARQDVLRGAIVYTTLEPCTARGTEPSCCSRLIRAKVSEVVIGMLDPNRDIRGKGWWELEESGIKVRYFDADIAQEIRRLNQEFIDYQLGVGLMITAVQPDGSVELAVTAAHRTKREILAVPSGKLTIRGTYRVKPTRGDRIVMLVRRGNRYSPQPTINFDHDRSKELWQAPFAWVHVSEEVPDNELVVARVSEDLHIAFQHYNTVHSDVLREFKTDKWFGVIMNPEPSGFERLANLWVRVEK